MDETATRERNAFLRDLEEGFASGDDGAILALAGERLRRIPGDLDARMAICRVWIRQGRLDEARGLLQEMEEPLAGLSRIYASLGDLSLKKGMREEARIYYQKGRALDPDAPEEDSEETDAGAEEASDIPADFQTLTLAALYLRQGHPTQAAEVLEAILLKDPQQEKAAEMLREARGRLGREGEAGGRDRVVAELSLWLDRITRRRAHAE